MSEHAKRKRIPAISVELDEEQIWRLQPFIEKINEAADEGHPGMLLAQLLPGDGMMKVFVVAEDQALAFQKVMGSTIGKTTAATKRVAS